MAEAAEKERKEMLLQEKIAYHLPENVLARAAEFCFASEDDCDCTKRHFIGEFSLGSKLHNLMTGNVCIIPGQVKIQRHPKLDEKLSPFFEDLDCKHRYGRVKKWLMRPVGTAKEFNYIIGPLAHSVYNRDYDPSSDRDIKDTVCPRSHVNLGLAAAEALAFKKPVLLHDWEYSAWLIVWILTYSPPDPDADLSDEYEIVASEQLAAWVIQVIGDPEICPNPYLRIEIMCRVLPLCHDRINDQNYLQLYNSIMSACSALCLEYLSIKGWGRLFSVTIRDIAVIFQDFIEDGEVGFLNDFNRKIVTQLSAVKEENANNDSESKELKTLIALLETTGGFAQKELMEFDNRTSGSKEILTDYIMYFFEMLITRFKECLQMPQLMPQTARFIIDVLECVLLSPAMDKSNGRKIEQLLKEFFFNSKLRTAQNMHIRQEILSQYGERLKKLGKRLEGKGAYPTIVNLIKHA